MPTYVYKFIDTGETIEVQQAFTDEALTHAEHPETGKKLKVKKVFTPVGVSFRGGGFYKTDSRGGKPKASSTTTSTDSSTSTDVSSSKDSSKDTSSKDTASKDKSSKSGSTSTTPTAGAKTPAKAASTTD